MNQEFKQATIKPQRFQNLLLFMLFLTVKTSFSQNFATYIGSTGDAQNPAEWMGLSDPSSVANSLANSDTFLFDPINFTATGGSFYQDMVGGPTSTLIIEKQFTNAQVTGVPEVGANLYIASTLVNGGNWGVNNGSNYSTDTLITGQGGTGSSVSINKDASIIGDYARFGTYSTFTNYGFSQFDEFDLYGDIQASSTTTFVANRLYVALFKRILGSGYYYIGRMDASAPGITMYFRGGQVDTLLLGSNTLFVSDTLTIDEMSATSGGIEGRTKVLLQNVNTENICLKTSLGKQAVLSFQGTNGLMAMIARDFPENPDVAFKVEVDEVDVIGNISMTCPVGYELAVAPSSQSSDLNAYIFHDGSVSTNPSNGEITAGTTLACKKSIVLPLSLVAFQARTIAPLVNQVIVRYDQQQHTQRVILERSSNAVTFDYVTEVSDLDSSGTLTYTDRQAVNGTTYYRIKMVELDNNIGYSKIISVSNISEQTGLLYPNPATDNFILNMENFLGNPNGFENVQVNIYDSSGHLVLSEIPFRTSIGNKQEMHFDISMLSVGRYHVLVEESCRSHAYSLVVVD